MRDLPTPLIPLIHHFFSSAQTSTCLCPNFHLSLPQFPPAFWQPQPNAHSICLFSIKDRHKKPPSTCYFPQNHKNTAKNTICPNKICIFKKKVVTLQAESLTNAECSALICESPQIMYRTPAPNGRHLTTSGFTHTGKDAPTETPSPEWTT